MLSSVLAGCTGTFTRAHRVTEFQLASTGPGMMSAVYSCSSHPSSATYTFRKRSPLRPITTALASIGRARSSTHMYSRRLASWHKSRTAQIGLCKLCGPYDLYKFKQIGVPGPSLPQVLIQCTLAFTGDLLTKDNQSTFTSLSQLSNL